MKVETPLDPLYERLPQLPQTSKKRQAIATASPLLFAMHTNPTIVAYDHMRYLDSHLVALCNMQLYPSGPGPEPEVWLRVKEGKGKYRLSGVGYDQVVSDEAYFSDEMILCRPGSAPDRNPERCANEDLVVTQLAIAQPPRTGKSMLVTENLPPWFLLRYPKASVVVSTYNQDFADTWGQNLQDMISERGKWFPNASDGQALSPLSSTQKHMSFRPGKDRGDVYFRGVGRSLTGIGYSLGIIDDPIKDQDEALSVSERSRKKNWYTSVFSNRKTQQRGMPPVIEIMMFTRWHEDDLAGAFVYDEDGDTPRDGWCVIRLPALAEEDDPLGREPGQSLCPQMARRSFLLKEQEKDPTWFSCLFQGRPTHQTGSMFAKTYQQVGLPDEYHHWWPGEGTVRYHGREIPADDMLYFATVDTATSKSTKADYSVVSMWGWNAEHGKLVLIDYDRDRVSSESHREWLGRFLHGHSKGWNLLMHPIEPMFVGIEDKTFGTALINELRKHEPGMVVLPIPADTDKITRATPYAEAVRGSRVLFPLPAGFPKATVWENEHVKFPRGTHDDMVDTGSMAWTVGQRYDYTPEQAAPVPDLSRHEKAQRQLRRGRGEGMHDYDLMRTLI